MPKKFLDQNGVAYLVSLLNNYPDNQILGTVIDAIQDSLDEKASTAVATTSANGLLSSQDKTFINSLQNRDNDNLEFEANQDPITNRDTYEFSIDTSQPIKYLQYSYTDTICHNSVNLASPYDTHRGAYLNDKGQEKSSANDMFYELINVVPGETIYIRGIDNNTGAQKNKRIHGYDEEHQWAGQIAVITVAAANVRPYTYTTSFVVPNDVYMIAFSTSANDEEVYIGRVDPQNTYIPFEAGTNNLYLTINNESYNFTIPSQYKAYYPHVEIENGTIRITDATTIIQSYNGELIENSSWVSNLDGWSGYLSENATPTIGATVMYWVDDDDAQLLYESSINTLLTAPSTTIRFASSDDVNYNRGLFRSLEWLKLNQVYTGILDLDYLKLGDNILSTDQLADKLTNDNFEQAQINGALKKFMTDFRILLNNLAYATNNHNALTVSNDANNIINLINNFYSPTSLTITLNLNDNIIRTNNSLNDLKQYLTVTANYQNGNSVVLNSDEYTLSGDLNLAANTYDVTEQTITVSSNELSNTFTVNVYNKMTLDKIQLPSGYTQLAMIVSAGSGNDFTGAYIDTNVTVNDVDHVEYAFQICEGIVNRQNWHILSSGHTWYPYIRQGSSGGRSFQGMNNQTGDTATEIPYTWTENVNYIIKAYPNVEINGTVVSTLSKGAQGADTYNFYLSARSTNDGARSRGSYRFYYVKMYDNQNTLVRNFIPCKNSSNIAGMYDTVSNSFFASGDNAQFIAGGVVE